MNNKKIITAFAAVTIIASSVFAGAGHKEGKHSLRNPENVVALMVNNHDVNQDGRLNSTELAKSIESLYELRNDAISNRREALVANGIISPVEAPKRICNAFVPARRRSSHSNEPGGCQSGQCPGNHRAFGLTRSLAGTELGNSSLLQPPFIKKL